MNNSFIFDPSDIIPIIEEGIRMEKLNLEAHRLLNHKAEALIIDTSITEAERLLSFLRMSGT